MRGNRQARKALWRWRSNPLRRRDDVLEAWVVLAVWALVVLGGTVAGTVTAHAAEESFAQQRAERIPVRAVLVANTPEAAANSYRVLAKVRWTDRDGTVHTDRTLVASGEKAGTGLTLWTNAQGEPTTTPPDPTEATIEAALLGTLAALTTAGLAFGAGGLARWRLERRRIEGWGREWDLVGPSWGHKTS